MVDAADGEKRSVQRMVARQPVDLLPGRRRRGTSSVKGGKQERVAELGDWPITGWWAGWGWTRRTPQWCCMILEAKISMR
jgi:hypothetical protein